MDTVLGETFLLVTSSNFSLVIVHVLDFAAPLFGLRSLASSFSSCASTFFTSLTKLARHLGSPRPQKLGLLCRYQVFDVLCRPKCSLG